MEDLRNNDKGQEPILGIPVFYQLIMAAALKHGNRSLVREMIAAAPPAPGHDLLFGPKAEFIPCPGGQLTFGGGKGYGQVDMDGQADNACDLWAEMIESG
ncbi:hypothetical protein IMZ48_40650, partial [Candidatus Bathyarchaeota archaeon]|nr:hypothetical protein [Candidatus Bathyarchaeota archaeon]